MAVLKHIAIKNADYSAAVCYLKYQHDERHLKPLLDENGNMMLRSEFHMNGVNCKPMVALALFSVFKRPCISRNHFVISQSDPEIFLPTPVCREPSASGQQQITSCSVPYQPTALGCSFAFPVPSA